MDAYWINVHSADFLVSGRAAAAGIPGDTGRTNNMVVDQKDNSYPITES